MTTKQQNELVKQFGQNWTSLGKFGFCVWIYGSGKNTCPEKWIKEVKVIGWG